MTSGNLGELDEETRQEHLKILQRKYLSEVTFPADREEIASAAERDGARQEFVEAIRNNGTRTSFNSPEELSDWLLGKYLETLQQYLPGVTFPAGREEIASAAERNRAPRGIVVTIRNKDAPTSFNSLVVVLGELLWALGKRAGIIVLEDLLPQLPREPG